MADGPLGHLCRRLSRFVAQLWDLESYGAYTRERMPPRTPLLPAHQPGDPHRRWVTPQESVEYRTAWVSGLHERFLEIEAPRASRLMGVMLTPTGARAVLGVPAGEFTNRVVELSDVIGPSNRFPSRAAPRERVVWKTGSASRIVAAEPGHRRDRPADGRCCARSMFASNGQGRVSGIARDLGMSRST